MSEYHYHCEKCEDMRKRRQVLYCSMRCEYLATKSRRALAKENPAPAPTREELRQELSKLEREIIAAQSVYYMPRDPVSHREAAATILRGKTRILELHGALGLMKSPPAEREDPIPFSQQPDAATLSKKPGAEDPIPPSKLSKKPGAGISFVEAMASRKGSRKG